MGASHNDMVDSDTVPGKGLDRLTQSLLSFAKMFGCYRSSWNKWLKYEIT